MESGNPAQQFVVRPCGHLVIGRRYALDQPMATYRQTFNFPVGLSEATKPVVAFVFPVSARGVVGEDHQCDVLRVLEAELGGYAQSQWGAPGRLQGLLLEIECQDRLRMQGAWHVD